MEIGEDASSAVGDYSVPFPFIGLVDEVRVYHGAVTADEIAEHCAAADKPVGKDARLVLRMSFDDGDAKDESGRGNHGRLEGARVVEGKIGKGLALAAPAGGADRPSPKRPSGAKREVAKPAPKKPATGSQRGYHVIHHWSQDIRAMVQAGDMLLIAGPPDVVDEEDAALRLGTEEIQTELGNQDAAMLGQRGGLLWVVSTKDGTKLGELRLPVPPTWDGMAVAQGRVYMTTIDGRVRCFGGR
jgi:hypothetical protein